MPTPGQDQQVTYRVNIDDSNFQAKLTSMRASMDTAMGGGGGMSPQMAFGMANAFQPGNFGMMNMANFGVGNSLAPVSFTPPAIAMQPHFGMFSIQQNLRQAGLNAIGPFGMSINNAMDKGIFSQQDIRDPRISISEYMAYSNQAFADRVQSAGIGATMGAANLTTSIAAGGAGAFLGEAMFSSRLGKIAGGLVGSMVVGTAVSEYVGAIADRAADNVQMQSALEAGSWRFYGGQDVDRITGRGMSRRGRFEAASSIQDMELRDTRFNATDYKQILEGGMQMGMFEGTHDIDDFKRKFKGLVDTLKTVSSTLHTSLQDGLEAMRSFRDMGVTGSSDVNRLTMQSEVLGRMSGRTGMEMLATGQTGAEMFRGTGIAMERGFQLAQGNAAMVRNLLNNGGISRETISQMGGEQGAAQQLTASALSSFQSTMGRGGLMAAFNPATGQLDPNFVTNMAKGDMLSAMGNAANLGPAGIMSLQANQEKLISKLDPMTIQMYGTAQMMAVGKNLQQSAPGLSTEDAMMYAGKSMGMSADLVQARIAQAKQDPDKFAQAQQLQMNNMRQQASLEDLGERHGWKNIGNAVSRTVIQPPARAVTSMWNSLAGEVEGTVTDIGDFVTGGHNVRGAAITNSLAEAGMSFNKGDAAASAKIDWYKNIQAKRRQFVISESDKDTSEFKFNEDVTSKIYDAMGGSSNSIGMEDFSRLVLGESKSIDRMSHDEIVQMRAYATKTGAKDISDRIDEKSQEASETAAARFEDAAKETAEAKSAARENLHDLLGGRWGMKGSNMALVGDVLGKNMGTAGTITKLLESGTAATALMELTKDPTSASAVKKLRKANESMGIASEDLDAVIHKVTSADKKEQQQLRTNMEKVVSSAGIQSAMGVEAVGGKEGSTFTGTAVGDISAKNMKALNDMAVQFEQQIKILSTMQKQLVADINRGKH